MMATSDIGSNVRRFLDDLRTELARCGRTADSVVVVAVSKTFSPAHIDAAIAAGLTEFGENRVQEAKEKIPQVRGVPGGRWHLIGHLQSNKARDAVAIFDLIHSVDVFELAVVLDHRAAQAGKRQDVLIQVNTSGERQKSGCDPDAVADLVAKTASLPHLRIMGLMTVGPFVPERATVERAFRVLRQAFDRLAPTDLRGGTMRYCSMGMTDDWQIALAEGANMLRIGRAIFGVRE